MLFTATAFLLAAGTFTSCSNGSSTALEISGDVLIKCYNDDIPIDGFIKIPDGVTTIGPKAFYHCINLESVKIPDSVTTIGDEAFQSCSNLRSVTIPDNVETIGSSAFGWCHNLRSVTIPYNVTRIGERAFKNCNVLTSVTFTDTAGWHYGQDGEEIDVTAPAKNATNLSYGEWSEDFLYKKTTEE